MTNFENGVESFGVPLAGPALMTLYAGQLSTIKFVDGDNGSDTNTGDTPKTAFKTIQTAVTRSSKGGVIYIFPKKPTDLAVDPNSYAETIIIPYTHAGLSLIGVGTGRTQGGLPQIKKGSGSTALLNIKAPGCTIQNLGFNGADSTGGGIKLSDDGTDPATTATSFGTSIINCHFKNCKCHATHASVGGAIYTTSAGGAWQLLVKGCTFYKCLGGIVVVGTGGSVPQDWIIEDNIFNSSVNTDVDGDIVVGGSGVVGLVINRNTFATMDVPTATTGDVGLYIKLATGSYGIVSNNMFACFVPEDGTEVTMGAAGSACVIPTTVKLVGNFGETSAAGASANTLDTGIVFRT